MQQDLENIWKALADVTRRDILDLLRHGRQRTSEIVDAFPHLSRFGVMKHLEVLKQCHLVITRRQGREVFNSINAAPLRQIYERWVSKYEDLWAHSLLRVKELAENEGKDSGGK